jgi:hypothetical protein
MKKLDLVKNYEKLVKQFNDLGAKIYDLTAQHQKAEADLAKARKAIRSQIQTTNKKDQSTAVMKFNGRVLKVRKNRYEVVLFENGKEIGRFNNIYLAEFAFATGQI